MTEIDGVIYLDHHATTPCAPEVVEAMLPYFTQHFGNPSSTDHVYGQKAAEAVERAREQVAKLINSRPEEIIFTSGATESDNLAIFGTTANAPKDKRHVITTQVEHKAVLEPLKLLEDQGWRVTYLDVDEFANIDLGELEDEIGEDTFLISIMAANNEVGTIYPLKEIGKLAKKYGIIFHTDAAQAVGHIPIDVRDMGVDLMSISAHKMYGPKGIGALYVRRRDPKVKVNPRQLGGAHERGMRSGTPATPIIVGFGVAAQLPITSATESSALRNKIYDQLNTFAIEIHLNGPLLDQNRLPQNLNIWLPGCESNAVMRLIRNRAAISTGSACTSSRIIHSHVLTAMGLEHRADSSLRIGLGRGTTSSQVELTAEAIKSAIDSVRLIHL